MFFVVVQRSLSLKCLFFFFLNLKVFWYRNGMWGFLYSFIHYFFIRMLENHF